MVSAGSLAGNDGDDEAPTDVLLGVPASAEDDPVVAAEVELADVPIDGDFGDDAVAAPPLLSVSVEAVVALPLPVPVEAEPAMVEVVAFGPEVEVFSVPPIALFDELCELELESDWFDDALLDADGAASAVPGDAITITPTPTAAASEPTRPT